MCFKMAAFSLWWLNTSSETASNASQPPIFAHAPHVPTPRISECHAVRPIRVSYYMLSAVEPLRWIVNRCPTETQFYYRRQ